MDLYPGTSIPPEELPKLRCKQKWNSVLKAYSDFTGKPYVINPVYEPPKYNKDNKYNKYNKYNKDNKTNKRRIYTNNVTKKR